MQSQVQEREQLRINVQPSTAAPLALRDRVVEPQRIEVLPPNSNTPVLVKERGQSGFTTVKGGELVKTQHGRPHALPPIQKAKDSATRSRGAGFSSGWQTRTSPSNDNVPHIPRGRTGIINTQGGQVLGYLLGGVVDEVINRPRHLREREILFMGLGNQAYYDAGRAATSWTKETLNNGWNHLRRSWDNLPKVSVPEFKLPRVNLPRFELPSIELPDLDIDFNLPEGSNQPTSDLPISEPVNERERQRQQEEDDLKERERERDRDESDYTVDDFARRLIDQMDEGCILHLGYTRFRIKYFTEYDSFYGYPVYGYTPWEPQAFSINRFNIPGDVDEYLQEDESFYTASWWQSTGKFRIGIYEQAGKGVTENRIQIEYFSIFIPQQLVALDPAATDPSMFFYDHDLNVFVHRDGEPLTDINRFALAKVESTCDVQRTPPKPYLPPEPETMDCCTCADIALIVRTTLKQLKYSVEVPIVTCEQDDKGVWTPKITYKPLEVFAVDASTATATAEQYRELAKSAREICEAKNNLLKLSDTIGVEEYPVKAPESLITEDGKEPKEKELKSLTEFFHWYVERFDEIVGQFEIPIEIKDSDPTTPGDQSKMLKLPNVAETLATMTELLLQISVATELHTNMQTRMMIDIGQDKRQNFISYYTIDAIADFLGFKFKEEKKDLSMMFTPEKQSFEEMLKECNLPVPIIKYDEKYNLQADLMRFREAAAILKGRHFVKLNPSSDLVAQIMARILGTSGLVDEINVEKESDDFDEFLNAVEQGFTNTAGVGDPAKPYGRDYEDRPRIRRIKKVDAEDPG